MRPNKILFTACYYAPIAPNESVLALKTKSDDSEMATGDTTGTLTIWHVADYCLSSVEV